MTTSSEERFSSRLGLILSVLGIAVGTGNIWRFPRIAAQQSGEDGAGAFLVAWVIALVLWSVPLIIAEYALGREGRMGVIGTFIRAAGERFAWMGAFVGLVATAIMFYYSVVAGWCVFYFLAMLASPLPETHADSTALWDGFQAGGWPVAFHALAFFVGALTVSKGIGAIERANKFLIPALFLILLVALGRALTLEGSSQGVGFLFSPDWDVLARPETWLEALTQNAWDTGAGWGLILTYAAYMRRSHGVVKNAFITAVGNNTVSLIAAIAVFGTVFATLGASLDRGEVLEVMQTSGPASTGLTFVWMPQLFSEIGFGRPLAVLFFLGLSFAAFSSLISMIELATRILVDLGLPRRRASVLVCSAGFLLGIPAAVDLDFLANQDFVWGLGLMISGLFVAVAVAKHGARSFRERSINVESGDWRATRAWDVIVTYLIPLQAAILLGWWLYLSASEYAPETWYDPLEPSSVMTCLVQWGVAGAVLIALNRWLVRRTVGRGR